MFTKTNIRSV